MSKRASFKKDEKLCSRKVAASVFPGGVDIGDVLRVPEQPAEVLLGRGRVPRNAAGPVADALLDGLAPDRRDDRLRDAADVLDAGEELPGLGLLERDDLRELRGGREQHAIGHTVRTGEDRAHTDTGEDEGVVA